MSLIDRRAFLGMAGAGALAAQQTSAGKPNIVFLLADDLGYGDAGCYGQKLMHTPNIDRMAAQGRRFTDFYAGDTVCAPSRCCLMTGYHTGHARIRGNALVSLEPEDVTVAEVLKKAGYATGIFGKWGLGEPGTAGVPNKKGFDEWFGYLNQTHAHNYYPDYLWENDRKLPLTHHEYSEDLFAARGLDFIARHKGRPYFLYMAFTLPHANNERFRATGNGNEVPNDEPYSKENWTQPNKDFAAMVTRLDADVGKILDAVDENTIVFFTSDNGPQKEGGNDPAFFHSSGPLRGIKRDLYEGGIREPMIVRWPGKVQAGSTSDFAGAFWDFLPTAAELAGTRAPAGIDGISFLPAILGKSQPKHEYLYWEFYERGFKQAARMGDWKGVRTRANGPLELYDLKTDLGERRDVAAQNADIVSRIEAIMRRAHTDSKRFPIPAP